jgi:hypothetical protein
MSALGFSASSSRETGGVPLPNGLQALTPISNEFHSVFLTHLNRLDRDCLDQK